MNVAAVGRPMTVFGAWRHGIRRVNRAPAVLIGVWVMTVLVSLPLTAAMRGMLRDHLGASLAADSAAGGVNYDWMQEFTSQASGVGATFGPAVVGFAAVLDNLSAFLDNTTRPIVVAVTAATYLGLWIFLAGGIIDRYARDRRTHAHGFFAASGVFFFRFLRLGVLMGLAYGLLVRYLHPWLFDSVYRRFTNDVTVERTAFLIRLALYAVFALGLAACNLLFDYAKVRAVVEDRRSMLGATAAGARFIARNAAAAAVSLPGQRHAVRTGNGRVCIRRPWCRRRRLVDVARVFNRSGVRAGAVVGQAGVLGLGDGALSGTARARRIRGGTEAGMAGVADG